MKDKGVTKSFQNLLHLLSNESMQYLTVAKKAIIFLQKVGKYRRQALKEHTLWDYIISQCSYKFFCAVIVHEYVEQIPAGIYWNDKATF